MSSLRIAGLDPATHVATYGGRRVGVSTIDVEHVLADAYGVEEWTVRAWCHRILDDGSVVAVSFGDYPLTAPFPAWVEVVVRDQVASFIGQFGVPAGVAPDLSTEAGFADGAKSWYGMLASATKDWEDAYRDRVQQQAKGVPIEEFRKVDRRFIRLEKRLAAVRRIADEVFTLKQLAPLPGEEN